MPICKVPLQLISQFTERATADNSCSVLQIPNCDVSSNEQKWTLPDGISEFAVSTKLEWNLNYYMACLELLFVLTSILLKTAELKDLTKENTQSRSLQLVQSTQISNNTQTDYLATVFRISNLHKSLNGHSVHSHELYTLTLGQLLAINN